MGKCSGTTKSAFKSLRPRELSTWKCDACKEMESDDDASNSESDNETRQNERTTASVNTLIEGLSQKLAEILSRLGTLEGKVDKQNSITEAVEKSMELLASKYDELLSKIADQENEIAKLKKTTEELTEKLTEKDTELARLKHCVESAEQYTRGRNVEIHGIPEAPNQDLYQVLADLSVKLNIQSPERQVIEALHRLKAHKDKIAPIIVRFVDQTTRDMWLAKKRALRADKIYINENLTRAHKMLLSECKKLAKDRGFKFVWVSNGKILVRKSEGASVISVYSERELGKIA